jgi:ubiquinone/menaquinone biosynthesis C-methylase UbiE
MKERMKSGFEGAVTDHVTHYDDVGLKHFTSISTELLRDVDLRGREVVDVGCGTGVLSLIALKSRAAKVVCGDLSEYMLSQCQAKATAQGYNTDQIETRQLDGESLPFEDNSFDAAISSMVLGFAPDQKKMLAEMARVTRSGRIVALATHGTDHYYEAIEAYLHAISKRYVLGYRMEFWPRKEKEISQMLAQAGLVDIQTRRLNYQDNFKTGTEAHDFFACTSASWWLVKFPPEKIAGEAKKAVDYFERKGVTQVTEDIILAHALKP